MANCARDLATGSSILSVDAHAVAEYSPFALLGARLTFCVLTLGSVAVPLGASTPSMSDLPGARIHSSACSGTTLDG